MQNFCIFRLTNNQKCGIINNSARCGEEQPQARRQRKRACRTGSSHIWLTHFLGCSHRTALNGVSLFTTGGPTYKGVGLVHIYNAHPVATMRESYLWRFRSYCPNLWVPLRSVAYFLNSVFIISYLVDFVNTFLIFFSRFLAVALLFIKVRLDDCVNPRQFEGS